MNNGLTNAERIYEFHETMGVTPPAQPTVPELGTLLVRRTLIDEEYGEVTAVFNQIFSTMQRGEAVDIVPLVHELTDLLYVTYGAIWACGVDPDPIFAEIHRANMQKANGPRRADGKVLKPADWQPPDVRGKIIQQKHS
ncbi:MAG: hypothetical protein H6662_02520 [Ardenticatenaceae bacterium]|nr:hypothetical protein [Anaerolineales bacterium]MCB8920433.1 hypothetical protein [Ardenticatenaceae bacterium]MCB8989388.1 hypothetical protein [Ardenticatenaceae bacterium]MCB9004543.1 hypothetical protein [Ardenticatenaceae bacterium]